MKKIVILMIFLISLLTLGGCEQPIVCNEPYIQVGSECCLDRNDNSICDTDEKTETPKEEMVTRVDVGTPKPPIKEDKVQMSAVPRTEESVRNFLKELFAVWEKRDYKTLYNMFDPIVRESLDYDEFVYMAKIREGRMTKAKLDQIISVEDNLATVIIEASYGSGMIQLPEFTLSHDGTQWRADKFGTFFADIETICAYENDQPKCIYDYSVKFKNLQGCLLAKGLATECIADLGSGYTLQQKIDACRDLSTAVAEDCVLEVAKADKAEQVCDQLDEEQKYKCKGYFASFTDDGVAFCDTLITEELDTAQYKQFSWCIVGVVSSESEKVSLRHNLCKKIPIWDFTGLASIEKECQKLVEQMDMED